MFWCNSQALNQFCLGHNFLYILSFWPSYTTYTLKQDAWTAMMLAAQDGHSNVVETLLQHGASVDIQNVVSIFWVMVEWFMFNFWHKNSALHFIDIKMTCRLEGWTYSMGVKIISFHKACKVLLHMAAKYILKWVLNYSCIVITLPMG